MHREFALDFDSLARRLQALAEGRGWQLVAEECAASTNDSVRSAMEAAHGEIPCVALAGAQTAGVGRRGARWQSGLGDGLWFSVAVPAAGQPGVSPPSLALAGELAECLRRWQVPVSVKWPNDLYLAGGKLGGLMLERGRFAGQVGWLAGVGINWRLPPEPVGEAYRPAALQMVDDPAWQSDPVALALELVTAAVDLLAAPDRWSAMLERLRREHYWFGQPVEVLAEHGPGYWGEGGEIGADGRLEVIRADGRRVTVGPNDRVHAAPPRR